MVDQSQIAKMLEGFLYRSVQLGKKIHEDSEKARDLVDKLKKTTNYVSIIEQEAKNKEKFLEQSHSLANAINSWANEYPKILDEFRKVLSILITDIGQIGFIVERTFPSFSITFNEAKFIYSLEREGTKYKLKISPEQEKEIAKKEHKIVNEIAEIISLEFHLQKFMENIQESINLKKIPQRCVYILSRRDIGDKFIEEFHEIVVWWIETTKILKDLKKVTYTAIELDADAAKKLDKLAKGKEILGMNKKQLEVVIGGLRVLGKLCLNIIPGGGFLSGAVDIYESRSLYRQALKEFKEAE